MIDHNKSYGPRLQGEVPNLAFFICVATCWWTCMSSVYDGFSDPIYGKWQQIHLHFPVVAVTCWWMWAQPMTVSLTQSMRNDCNSWVRGYSWTERPSTNLGPGPSRMTLSLRGSGEGVKISVWLSVTVFCQKTCVTSTFNSKYKLEVPHMCCHACCHCINLELG